MVIDNLKNLRDYASLNPLFAQAIDYIENTDLKALAPGKIVLVENELIVNVNEIGPKTKEEAKLETHNEYIDIQIPLTDVEQMGYTQRADLPEEEYDAVKDLTLYEGLADDYLTVKPGMFTLFFPSDGHAPGITPTGLKKIIVKVKR
ncbi:MAG: YhcH/YjgK/YiaL family protein [Bacteroidaceae bacterium]|nr:YhcH/YjgK/YiaL family protein [Bacteroidaceae bacterium]